MATINEYTTGKICEQLKLAFSLMDTAKGSLKGTDIGETMLANVKKMMPKKITFDKAIELIEASENYAISPRVCLAVHKDAFIGIWRNMN